MKGLASLEPADADAASVADAIVDMPFGSRPFRTDIDPPEDGVEIVNGIADRAHSELFRRIGLENLLKPHIQG